MADPLSFTSGVASILTLAERFLRPDITNSPASLYRAIAWLRNKTGVYGIRYYEVPGFLNGIPINALPDSGSGIDAVSESFAKQHGLTIEPTDTQKIYLPGGNRTESIGRTVGHFKFKGESQSYRREFRVLRKSMYDLVLGRRFLTETKTLTDFQHRIKKSYRPCIQKGNRLFLMDESPKDRLCCTINGCRASAFPDTGSDLMIISGDYARRNAFVVHREEKYRTQIQLIDGSTIHTDGMVLDAKLQFDGPLASACLSFDKYFKYIDTIFSLMSKGDKGKAEASFLCDLHVAESLPCDIILSSDFVFQNQIFSNFEDLCSSDSAGPPPPADSLAHGGILFMRTKEKKFRWLRWRRATQTQTSPTPPQHSPTWDELWEIEVARRNQKQLWIAFLPEPQKSIEERSESQKQALWDSQNPRPSPPRLPTSDPTLRRRAAAPGVATT
ncbi:hypothetical protein F4811DRAFT_21836 [Daldinia bambusicola]|nr:hypothetical protein F4811DRAFT_21836 [Daldinia bambusicola]